MKCSYLYIIWIISIFIVCCKVSKPNTQIVENQEEYWYFEENISMLEVSDFGQIFILKDNYEIIQLDTQSRIVQRFNMQTKGEIHDFSFQQNLSYLLFYYNTQEIVILDRYFSILKEISMADWQLFQVSAIVQSVDGNVWLFDTSDRQLKKYDLNGNLLVSSLDLFNLVPNYSTITKIWTFNNTIYLKNEIGNIYKFDIFGNFLFHYDINTPLDLVWVDGYFYYIENNILKAQYMKTESENNPQSILKIVRPLDAQSIIDFDFVNNYMFTLDEKGIKKNKG